MSPKPHGSACLPTQNTHLVGKTLKRCSVFPHQSPPDPSLLRGQLHSRCPVPAPQPPTHKVLSLGMWLKLDTGIELMLLLFRVLHGSQPLGQPSSSNRQTLPPCSTATHQGAGSGLNGWGTNSRRPDSDQGPADLKA